MPNGCRSSDAREALIQRLVKRYEEVLRRRLTSGPQTIEEIEREISEISKELNKISQDEKITDAAGDGLDHTCTCVKGHPVVLRSWNTKQLTTLHAKTSLRRAYYYCQECRSGFCPVDAILGLGSGELSIGMQALVTRLSCYLPGRKAAVEAELLTDVALSHSTVQRVAQAAGQQLGRDWQTKQELLWSEKLADPQHSIKRLQTTMDGVMIFVGKQWRESKVGVAYERDDNGKVARASYCATMKPAAEFGRLWRTLNHVAGAGKTKNIGVVADGADWIWKEVGKYHPESVQILDNMHGLDHIWNVAHSRFGQGTAGACEWMDIQKERLSNDKVDEVIREIRSWRPKVAAKKEVRRLELAYLKTHRHRMLYKTFEEQGYHIGSGVVEAANKNVVQARMKRAGMRWELPGAEAQLQLLATWHTCQSTDFANVCRRATAHPA
jgi:hypothetical protein